MDTFQAPQLSLFEKISQGLIPSSKVYETDSVYAFLDINPVNKGHTLVVPKKCYKDLLEMPDEILHKVQTATRVVAKAIMAATGATGFNIIQNNGADSGQIVFHYHVHIIPRFKGDGQKTAFDKHNPYASAKERNDMAEKISKQFMSRKS